MHSGRQPVHWRIYLQGRTSRGPSPPGTSRWHRSLRVILAPLADRLLAREMDDAREDHTAELRRRLSVEELLGTSARLANLFQSMLVAAPVDMSVLIEGESGTGKTAVAQALHRSSARGSGPFVELNCAAIPATLFESELFGAEKGAHSTADRRIEGKVDRAVGGTLFLDEIAEIPLKSRASC